MRTVVRSNHGKQTRRDLSEPRASWEAIPDVTDPPANLQHAVASSVCEYGAVTTCPAAGKAVEIGNNNILRRNSSFEVSQRQESSALDTGNIHHIGENGVP